MEQKFVKKIVFSKKMVKVVCDEINKELKSLGHEKFVEKYGKKK